MPTHLVNLDALIEQDDFESAHELSVTNSRKISNIRVSDLEMKAGYYQTLRKPDFQRETNNWSAKQIVAFIKSVLDGDLIPAIIMWRSDVSGKIFAIDGAHRLSALIAWVNDDYGDGDVSKASSDPDVIAEQKPYADAVRRLLAEEHVENYRDLSHYLLHQATAPEQSLRRARNLATFELEVQKVEGTPEKAQNAFFRINLSSTSLDDTEKSILKARKKPNTIAARALCNAGKGNKYWEQFPYQSRNEIESISASVYDRLFKRGLNESPVKSMDVTVAGGGYSATSFKFLLDLVNTVNNITDAMWMEGKSGRRHKGSLPDKLGDDLNGAKTVEFLKRVQRRVDLIFGEKGSLGLHPFVYFRSATGGVHTTAILAAIQFFNHLRRSHKLIQFTEVRFGFEEFLVNHKRFTNQLSHGYGSRTRPMAALVGMYEIILKSLIEGTKTEQEIVDVLMADSRFASKLKEHQPDDEPTRGRKGKLSKDTRSAAFAADEILNIKRCAICSARMHRDSMNADHITRVQDGGTDTEDNCQFTHFFCNDGYKEHKIHIERLKRTKDLVG